VDCDVIQADGGTRTASITGGYVALVDALRWLQEQKNIFTQLPITGSVAAVSVGLVDSQPALDLCYIEDFAAQVDMNVVMTDQGEFIEVQGTGEEHTFTEAQLHDMLGLAKKGIAELAAIQRAALDAP
jgi:ribonuclease PH